MRGRRRHGGTTARRRDEAKGGGRGWGGPFHSTLEMRTRAACRPDRAGPVARPSVSRDRPPARRAIVQLRRPRHFDSPPTQHHAYTSRSSHQSSWMCRDEPVAARTSAGRRTIGTRVRGQGSGIRRRRRPHKRAAGEEILGWRWPQLLAAIELLPPWYIMLADARESAPRVIF
jgi:hypothetical protein